jgi:type IV pilus assembly protein PilO
MAMLDQIDVTPALTKFGRLPSAQKAIVLVALSVGLVALYWFFFYGNKRTELLSLEQRLTQLEAKLNESRAIASNLKSFQEEIARLEARFEVAVQRLPNSTELPVLLTDITSLGKKSGLEFHSFRPRSEVRRGFYAEVPIQIEVTGAYHNLGVFFDRLSRMSRIVHISEVSLGVGDDTADPPVLKMRGTAKTFRFVDQGETGGK